MKSKVSSISTQHVSDFLRWCCCRMCVFAIVSKLQAIISISLAKPSSWMDCVKIVPLMFLVGLLITSSSSSLQLYVPTGTWPASLQLSALWALPQLLIEGLPLHEFVHCKASTLIHYAQGVEKFSRPQRESNPPSPDWRSIALTTNLTGDPIL